MVSPAPVVSPAPRYNVKEAERKLLTYDHGDKNNEEGFADVQLRRAFEHPPGIGAEDVFVQFELSSLKRGKGLESRKKLALAIVEQCVDRIAQKYTAASLEEAKLVLKLYPCQVTPGNRADRIYANETGNGHVRLTLAWILALKDGSIVLDGGRMNEVDGHMYGLGDITRIANPERTLRNMANRMCDAILQQTDISSRLKLCGCV